MSKTVFTYAFAGMEYNPTYGILNIQQLIFGMPCLFTFICYHTIAIHRKLSKPLTWFYISLPSIILFVGYFVWHAISGEDPLRKYYTSAEFLANIASPTVVMRLVILMLLVFYILYFAYNCMTLIPIYEKYVSGNFSDSSYNVGWLYGLLRCLIAISIAYIFTVLCRSEYFNTLYFIAAIPIFYIMIENSIYNRTFENIDAIELKWGFFRGWYVEEEEKQSSWMLNKLDSDHLAFGRKLDAWMLSDKPFVKIDFSLSDILDEFPDMNREVVLDFFKTSDLTFQSFARQYRILEVCDIIKADPENVITKQLFARVGFSHYSSFSRSFDAVMGISPSAYIDKQIAIAKELKSKCLQKRSGGGDF